MNPELFRTLAVLAEPPQDETARLAQILELGSIPRPEDYTDLFLFQLYPYASVYLDGEGMLGGEARDRVAGFWRALGEQPPAEPDHLAILLALYAHLTQLVQEETDATRRAGLSHARSALLWEHLLSWLGAFLAKVGEIAPPAYAAWGRLLDQALMAEAQTVAPAPLLPLHLREAPALADLVELDDLVATLLVPVRSGMILTRTDLARAGRALGLSLRAGERRYVLKHLLGQDGPGMVRWLQHEAAAWERRHIAREPQLRDIARFWTARARRTREALVRLERMPRSLAVPELPPPEDRA